MIIAWFHKYVNDTYAIRKKKVKWWVVEYVTQFKITEFLYINLN